MPMIRVAMPLVGLLAVGVVSPPSAVAATPRCHGVVATIVGTDNRDELVGTSGRDVIVAGAGWDRIEGGGGSDLICGGRGSDHLWGGAGDDRLFGGADGALPDDGTLDYYGDTLRGGVGDDRIVGGDAPGSDSVGFETARHGLSGDLATGFVTGQGRDTLLGLELLTGSRYADHLTVARPTRLVDGAGGDDVLRCRARTPCFVAGGDGDDRLLDVRGGHGGAGDDRITARAGGGRSKGSSLEGAQGDDILIGTDESDRLSGGYGRDILRAAGGDDTIENDRGDGIVYAGAGDDWIFDGPAVDKISAGPGDDTVQPESGHAETFDLGPGNDTIDFAQTGNAAVHVDLRTGRASGGSGNDTIVSAEGVVGSSGDDTIIGTDADETFNGDFGDDVVNAGGGADLLLDGVGDDQLTAGPGDDTFDVWEGTYRGVDQYAGGEGVDLIDVFEAYSQAPDPLVVDLAAGVITGLGGDTISGFENIAGSHYGTEILRGDDGPNRIDGRAGDDTLVGAGGDDVLNGDAGTDDADGGDGTDLCTAETVAHCEG